MPALVRLGKQAREDGASQSDNVVGDVVEALIGALFLDGGLEAAERFILDAVGARPRESSGGRRSTPSRRFRNSPRREGCKAPVYEVVSPHRRAPRAEVHRSSLGADARRGDGRGLEQAGSGNRRGRQRLLTQLQ